MVVELEEGEGEDEEGDVTQTGRGMKNVRSRE